MILRLFHVNLRGWRGLHQVNQRRNSEYNILLTSWIHTRIHNDQSLKYNRLSKSGWKIYKNIALRFKNKSQGFLLMLIEAIKPENFAHFPELIRRHFYTHVCESSTHDFCVLPLQICKVKCEWFIRADVTEIVLVARVRRRYFRRRQATARNKSIFACYLCLWNSFEQTK